MARRGQMSLLLLSRVPAWLTFDPSDPQRFEGHMGSLTEATFSFHLSLGAATAEAEKVSRRPCWGVSAGSLSAAVLITTQGR